MSGVLHIIAMTDFVREVDEQLAKALQSEGLISHCTGCSTSLRHMRYQDGAVIMADGTRVTASCDPFETGNAYHPYVVSGQDYKVVEEAVVRRLMACQRH